MSRRPDQVVIDRIMATAEQLYGERGISAVSLREIASAAGSKNNNAIQYHFGGVSELITAILRKRLPEVEHRRAQLLDHLTADGAIPDLKGLIGALLLPLLTLSDDQGAFAHARLHLAILNHPRDYLWSNPFQDQQPAAIEILDRIATLLPMPKNLYFERLRLVTMMALNSLFNRPPLLVGTALEPYLLDSVLEMATAALAAPLPTSIAGDADLPLVPSPPSMPTAPDAADGTRREPRTVADHGNDGSRANHRFARAATNVTADVLS